jgi:hypothetical protein
MKRLWHLVWADPEWVAKYQNLFCWSDEKTAAEVKRETRRRDRDRRRVLTASHKFTYRDHDYDYPRKRRLEALAQRELYNECNQYRQSQSRQSDGVGKDDDISRQNLLRLQVQQEVERRNQDDGRERLA